MSFKGTGTAYFVYTSEITKIYRACDFFANVTGPKMSAATMRFGALVSKDCKLASQLFRAIDLAAQCLHFTINVSTLGLSPGHRNLCLIRDKVFSIAK